MTRKGVRWTPTLCLFVVLGASYVAVRPLFSVPAPSGDDVVSHLFRLAELDRVFRQGVLYPRWMPSFLFGYGFPLFNFMAPLVYYVAETLHLAGLSIISALTGTMALGVFASGLAMYFFSRDVFGRAAAVVSAIAYVFLPYALFDIYARVAVPEGFAFCFLPLVLWAVHRAIDKNSLSAAFWGALPLAGLVLTHNPSALVFVPLSAVYALCLAVWPIAHSGSVSRKSRAKTIAAGLSRVLLLYVLGMGLGAFLWLPARLEQEFIYIGTLWQGDPQFLDLLFPFKDLVQPSFFYRYDEGSTLLVHVGLVQAILAAASTILAVWLRPDLRRYVLPLLLMTLIPLLLMTSISAPLWKLSPTMTLMSFPWRLLMFVGLGTSVLTGLIASAFVTEQTAWTGTAGNERKFLQRAAGWSKKHGLLPAAVGAAFAALIVASGLKDLAPRPLDMEDARLTRASYAGYEALTAFIGTTIPAQFTPVWVRMSPYRMRLPEQAWPLEGKSTPFESVQLEAMNGWYLKARVKAREQGNLIAHIVYFPGWVGKIDGTPVAVEAHGPLGLVAVNVPEGEHTVELSIGSTTAARIGYVTSGFAILVIASAAAFYLFRRAKSLRWRAGFLMPVFVFGISPFILFLSQADHPSGGQIIPLALDVGEGQTLVGWRARTDRMRDSGMLELSSYWHVRRESKADRPERIRFTDSSGRTITEVSVKPDLGNSPTLKWIPGEIIEDRQDIPWPVDVSAGLYHVEIALVDPSGENDDGRSPTTFTRVGEVRLEKSPPSAGLPDALQRATPSIFEGGIALRGFLIDGKPPNKTPLLKPGDKLEVKLFWQTPAPIAENYSVFLHLSDRSGKNLAQTDSFPPFDMRFTSLWRPGAIVHQRYWLTIPNDAAMGVYDLATGLYRRDDLSRLSLSNSSKESRVILTRLRVAGEEKTPEPQQKLDARFANGAALLGWSMERQPRSSEPAVRRGTALPLTLHWKASSDIDEDYVVFVHLADQEGRPVAQVDSEPMNGRVPMGTWQPEESVADRKELEIPANLPPGEYELLVGFCSLPDGKRSPVSYQGKRDDKVSLGKITVVD